MKLTDFDYDDLMLLCITLKGATDEALKNLQFLQENCVGSDLIPFYESRFDRLQRLYTQAQEAAINVGMVEKIKMNRYELPKPKHQSKDKR